MAFRAEEAVIGAIMASDRFGSTVLRHRQKADRRPHLDHVVRHNGLRFSPSGGQPILAQVKALAGGMAVKVEAAAAAKVGVRGVQQSSAPFASGAVLLDAAGCRQPASGAFQKARPGQGVGDQDKACGDVGGYGGGVSGEAVLTRQGRAWSGVMRVANPSSARTAGAPAVCEIELAVSEPYRLQLKERDGCSYFRGAACEFTGTVTHDEAGL